VSLDRKELKDLPQITKEGYIWSLMPNVNEEILQHNINCESGIQRMWEDEDIDYKMRDMRISEGCLLTQEKAEAFNREFRMMQEPMIAGRPRVKV
jgi:hypothetical protein